VSDEMKVGYWRAGHGGHLTVEQNREHDAACDGHGACTWGRSEEPHHAAAREATDDERKILSHLRERAVRAALRQEGPNGGSPSAVEPRSGLPRENGRGTLLDPTSAHREAR
jgi:hypothetical protein